VHLKNQAKLQHCNDRNTLSSPHYTSFLIQFGIIFTMASRQFTVDLAKKNKFVDIFLLMPKTGVTDAMRSAKFIKEDIADLQIRRFLQRALPGGSIKGLKAYVAGLLCPTQLVDGAAIVANVDTAIVHVKRTPPLSLSMLLSTSSQGQ
jgi:hypothetical protein